MASSQAIGNRARSVAGWTVAPPIIFIRLTLFVVLLGSALMNVMDTMKKG